MGSVSDSRLRRRRAATNTSSWIPRKIGAADARMDTSATLIRRVDGVWVYTEEVPIEVTLNKFLEVDLVGTGSLLWTGVEVKTRDPRLKSHQLVASLQPHGRNWWSAAPFLRSLNRSRAERLARLLAEVQDARRGGPEDPPPGADAVAVVPSQSILNKALAGLDFDPFESDRKIWTARLPDPMRLRWRGADALSDDFALVPPNPNREMKARKPQWYFGACAGLNTGREEIRKALVASPRFWNPKRLGRELALTGRVTDALTGIIDAAVWQALSGRPASIDPRPEPVHERAITLAHRIIDAKVPRDPALVEYREHR